MRDKGGEEKVEISGTASGNTRIIKRYKNRKLYDVTSSTYVSLNDISDMLKNGFEVKVLDYDSGQDITSMTLANIILETERKGVRFLGFGLIKRFFESLFSADPAFTKLKGDIEKTVRDLIVKGEINSEDGVKILRDLLLLSRSNLESIRASIDEKVSDFFSKLFPLSKLKDLDLLLRSLREIRRKIEILEEKIEKLERTKEVAENRDKV